MPKKHIIIISTMLIIGLGFFVTSWILSHRRTSDVDSNEEIVSNVPKTLDVPGRISTPRKKKEVVLTEETQTGDDTQKISDAVDYNQDEEWLEEFPDSLVEEKNEDASQVEENTMMYAALKEPFEQLHSFYTQSDSIEDELAEMIRTGRGFGIVNGRIEMNEFFGKLDEKYAIYRQILETAKEVQRIVPNAVEIIEVSSMGSNTSPYSGPERFSYDIKISRQNLESSLGKIPTDIEAIFPDERKSVVVLADENFNWVKWYRDNERERLARQAARNR